MLQKEMKLTTTQQTSVENVFKTFFNSEDKLHKENPPPPPAAPNPKVKAAMDKLVVERDEAIKKILTVDQYKKYTEVAKNLHPPKPPGKNAPPPPPMH